MRAGGNQKLIDWFQSHDITSDQRIAKKYHSPAAELFRERCDELLPLHQLVSVCFSQYWCRCLCPLLCQSRRYFKYVYLLPIYSPE